MQEKYWLFHVGQNESECGKPIIIIRAFNKKKAFVWRINHLLISEIYLRYVLFLFSYCFDRAFFSVLNLFCFFRSLSLPLCLCSIYFKLPQEQIHPSPILQMVAIEISSICNLIIFVYDGKIWLPTLYRAYAKTLYEQKKIITKTFEFQKSIVLFGPIKS